MVEAFRALAEGVYVMGSPHHAAEPPAAGRPASNLITRRTLGWEPTQPGLLADLDNGHYFPGRGLITRQAAHA
ncbi:hypothetical protein GCM10011588_48300 [Nocardia jinanensis]|uniref:Uncharacterized protein n=1 Tax=Nocardia jinanensis TaxID=382504 RepID=A0A917VXD3_9NOCA|nr:hypothetical protein GCM10011588_48300 [Nocardia jinanensis]